MIPWTVACQVPLSMEFSRPEYWSGEPLPSPGDLPDTGIKLRSPALQEDPLPSKLPGKNYLWVWLYLEPGFWQMESTLDEVILYYKESWAWRIDAFELWYWRRLLRVPWIVRRSNSSILKAISPEYSLEGLMLKLKLQYFGHLMWRPDSLEKTLMLGKIEGRRKRGR